MGGAGGQADGEGGYEPRRLDILMGRFKDKLAERVDQIDSDYPGLLDHIIYGKTYSFVSKEGLDNAEEYQLDHPYSGLTSKLRSEGIVSTKKAARKIMKYTKDNLDRFNHDVTDSITDDYHFKQSIIDRLVSRQEGAILWPYKPKYKEALKENSRLVKALFSSDKEQINSALEGLSELYDLKTQLYPEKILQQEFDFAYKKRGIIKPHPMLRSAVDRIIWNWFRGIG